MSEVRAPWATMSAWALAVPAAHVDAVVALRLVAEIEVAEAGGECWLRGPAVTPDVALLLLRIPTRAYFHWLAGDALCPVGSRLATARLPDTKWHPLREWIQVMVPAAEPVRPVPLATVRLSLVSAETWCEANAWLTTLAAWTRWAQAAPLVRLERLRFAATTTGRVLVLGTPPPSMPGAAMMESDGIVLPAACRWQPAVSAETLRRALGAGARDVILWEHSGAQLLAHELFVPASRAAVRLTGEAAK